MIIILKIDLHFMIKILGLAFKRRTRGKAFGKTADPIFYTQTFEHKSDPLRLMYLRV